MFTSAEYLVFRQKCKWPNAFWKSSTASRESNCYHSTIQRQKSRPHTELSPEWSKVKRSILRNKVSSSGAQNGPHALAIPFWGEGFLHCCDPESKTTEIPISHTLGGGFLDCDPESKTRETLKPHIFIVWAGVIFMPSKGVLVKHCMVLPAELAGTIKMRTQVTMRRGPFEHWTDNTFRAIDPCSV